MEHFDKGLIEVLAFQSISFTERKRHAVQVEDKPDGVNHDLDEDKSQQLLTAIYPNTPLWR